MTHLPFSVAGLRQKRQVLSDCCDHGLEISTAVTAHLQAAAILQGEIHPAHVTLEDEGEEAVEILGETDDSPAGSRTGVGNLEHVVDESVDGSAS